MAASGGGQLLELQEDYREGEHLEAEAAELETERAKVLAAEQRDAGVAGVGEGGGGGGGGLEGGFDPEEDYEAEDVFPGDLVLKAQAIGDDAAAAQIRDAVQGGAGGLTDGGQQQGAQALQSKQLELPEQVQGAQALQQQLEMRQQVHRHQLPARPGPARGGPLAWVVGFVVVLHLLALLVWLRAWWRQRRSNKPATMRTPTPPQKVSATYDMDKPAFTMPKIELAHLTKALKPPQA